MPSGIQALEGLTEAQILTLVAVGYWHLTIEEARWCRLRDDTIAHMQDGIAKRMVELGMNPDEFASRGENESLGDSFRARLNRLALAAGEGDG